MKKWQCLDQATTPDGSIMSLHRHDDTYVVRVNGHELMSSRHFASEVALAEYACLALASHKAPKVLIGGLGLGYTLRTALGILSKQAKVVVAELMPIVVQWNKNPDYPLAKSSVEDKRTEIILDDVAKVIARSSGGFDAIMLDADNGTTAMSTVGNQSLYEREGLAQVRAALRPGGLVVYWSAQDDPIFAKQMTKAGFKVSTEKVRSHATSGGLHTLLIGRTKTGPRAS